MSRGTPPWPEPGAPEVICTRGCGRPAHWGNCLGRRVLVCGSRNYNDEHRVFTELDAISPSLIIEGGADGAYALAVLWAEARSCELASFPADWAKHGRAAGPIRNQQMIDEGKPDLVLAFPGGPGTADMVRRAKAAGIEVIRI